LISYLRKIAVRRSPFIIIFFMLEDNSMHFLKMSGIIAGNKEKEFEQTIQFVFNQLSSDCLEKVLSMDMHKKDHYHIYYLWRSGGALKKFMASIELQLIKGAFDTLGKPGQTLFGTCVETSQFKPSDSK
jgi:hypothetical protein